MKKNCLLFFLMFWMFVSHSLTAQAQKKAEVRKIQVSLQKRVASPSDPGVYVVHSEVQQWNPKETAIIICDMWDQHWCIGATSRVTELAPAINQVASIAREKGVLIVHSPSNCMAFYENYPGRKLAEKYKDKTAKELMGKELLPSEKGAVWPIDQEDGGCDDTPECVQRGPYTREIALIEIKDKDAISEYGDEVAGLFKARGIRNVILMGVHENMCVIGRPFGLRNMVRLGMNVVVMRDLTDTMYDSKEWPVVSHFAGTSLMTGYIEKYVCPSIVSSDFTGQKPFKFKMDNRPVVGFVE